MMKENISRDSIGVNDMLKRIIIRFDYTGVTSISKWIEEIKKDEAFKLVFSDYKVLTQKFSRLDVSNIREVANKGFIPLEEFVSEKLHTFRGKLDGKEENLSLEITSTSCSVDIQCNGHYDSLNPYLLFIEKYMDKFTSFDSYITLSRIGLRKIDAKSYDNKENISKDFDSKFFFGEAIKIGEDERKEYKDNLVDQQMGMKANILRACRPVKENGKMRIQAILDADVYEDLQTKDKINFSDIPQILEALNNYLFEIFKTVMSQDFLQKHTKQ